MLFTVVVAFVIVMGVAGAAVLMVKKQLSAFMAERAEKQAQEKERNKAEEGNERKGKIFGNLGIGGIGGIGGIAALPESFAKPPAAALPGPAGNGVAPLPDLPPPHAEAPLPNPAPPPGMMLDAGPAPAPGAGAGAGAGGGEAKPRNVQAFAAQQTMMLPLTATPQARAANLGERSYLLARGAFIPCVLETQLISNIPGNASCVLPQNIYSDDGKVLLMEKGSKIVGQYQSDVRAGDSRIAILWQRVKTTTGVVVDVDSPAASGVGAMGAAGVVDNHWSERIGAAFLLSLVDDAIKIEVAKHSQGNTVVLPSASIGTAKSLSEKVLDSTINIAPTLYKNRGDRLMVYVNRDLWFNGVYNLNQR
ncbi:type IV secretion system protein VirB10 [Rugamonas sp. DEMB1]|uniref:type IV secretion system protein VirB10 n=1 Tax=Rugamonas sp. DEMB1 TaxID=3039386 RepID=UPI00244BAF80|nr:type IV secretion system protein VirB10 [Rugamonas sp. DEMB1]WGG49418.1 type IV secretion system protein VirB10 [Rugamonas sp. DEMB1]